jgi:proton glutamate symport protein
VTTVLDRFSVGRGLMIATLLALAGGVAAGIALPSDPSGAGGTALAGIGALGAAWVRALRMVVLPLVVSLLVLAVLGRGGEAGMARLGGSAIGVYVTVYVVLATLAYALYPVLIRVFGVAYGAISDVRMESAGPLPTAPTLDVGGWLVESLPTNPFAAAAEENLIQVVVFTVLFAVAAARIGPPAREALQALLAPVADAMLVIVAWLLKVSPLPVFALALDAARELGLGAAWALLAFAISSSLLMFLAMIGFAPVAGLLGRVGTARFARAAWPGQIVGLTTRSSLAALPVLVEEATSRLRLPASVVGFGLPFAAATFKPNRILSETGKLLFLAWLYAVPVHPIGYAGFVGYIMLLAATTVGVPNNRSGFSSLPAYLALGIPVEGLILIDSVDMLWDPAASALNATGYLAVTSLLPKPS